MRLIALYEALCHPNRLRILHLLSQGPLCVQHLESALNLSQVEISKHLAYLRVRDLVEATKDRYWRFYAVPRETVVALAGHFRWVKDTAEVRETLEADLTRLNSLLPPHRRAAQRRPATRVTPPPEEPAAAPLEPGMLEHHLL